MIISEKQAKQLGIPEEMLKKDSKVELKFKTDFDKNVGTVITDDGKTIRYSAYLPLNECFARIIDEIT